MKIFADLHIHSKYARATSKNMDLENLSKFGKLKGLNLIGTGDFTHPKWLKELKEKLKPIEDTGIYSFNGMNFILTTEISTVYIQDNKVRKIHHVIHVPSLEIVDQINNELTKLGAKLDIDGRLLLNERTSVELVETLIKIYDNTLIVPAHAWTPWFSLFGSKSGFDKVEDCYKDQTKYIYALETGLSSDPPMNWRLSSLDKFALMSNSDCHSPWPWRLGRECNVFELEKMTYWEILDAVKKKDKKRFLFTVEVSPAYGKYHWTGHRNCNVSLSPKQSLKVNNICPVCHRKLTVGVEERVEELADREEGFVPKDVIPFKDLLPLFELINVALRIDSLYSKSSWLVYNKLIQKFGNEFNVLLDVPREELEKVAEKKLVEIIMKNREGKIKIIPGFDGVYGKPMFDETEFKQHEEKQKNLKIHTQKRLFDFKGL
jgi:uncharacterized protein (TIGR00375 family)